MAGIAKVEVVLLDDWGLTQMVTEPYYDLLEIFEEQHGHHSSLVTRQLPIENGMRTSMIPPSRILFWIDWYIMHTK